MLTFKRDDASWMHRTNLSGSRGRSWRGSQETQKEGGDGLREEGLRQGKAGASFPCPKRAHLHHCLKHVIS